MTPLHIDQSSGRGFTSGGELRLGELHGGLHGTNIDDAQGTLSLPEERYLHALASPLFYLFNLTFKRSRSLRYHLDGFHVVVEVLV